MEITEAKREMSVDHPDVDFIRRYYIHHVSCTFIFFYIQKGTILENRSISLPAFLRRPPGVLFFASVTREMDKGVCRCAIRLYAGTLQGPHGHSGLTHAEHSPRSVPSNDVYSSTPERWYVVHPWLTELTWLIVSRGCWRSSLLFLLFLLLFLLHV